MTWKICLRLSRDPWLIVVFRRSRITPANPQAAWSIKLAPPSSVTWHMCVAGLRRMLPWIVRCVISSRRFFMFPPWCIICHWLAKHVPAPFHYSYTGVTSWVLHQNRQECTLTFRMRCIAGLPTPSLRRLREAFLVSYNAWDLSHHKDARALPLRLSDRTSSMSVSALCWHQSIFRWGWHVPTSPHR